MREEEIKEEEFKAVPDGATIEKHTFKAKYKKRDQRLVKGEDGTYIIVEKSERVPGTLKDLDTGKNYNNEENEEKKIKEDEKLCDFVCKDCDKLKMGQCKEESMECDTCYGKMTAVYYRKKTKEGDMVFRKPFSAKKK